MTWITGTESKTVIDVGCGPGNLTAQVQELGHRAIGVDPSLSMLHWIHVPAVCGVAEALPLRNACADVVTAATAFHWLDHDRALPEMRRVLRRAGRVGLITNVRDESVDWVKALSDIIGSESAMAVTLGGLEGMEESFTTALRGNGLFDRVESQIFPFQQDLTAEDLVGLVASRSYVAILPSDARAALFDRVLRLCNEHPDLAGQQSFTLPYQTHVFRAVAA